MEGLNYACSRVYGCVLVVHDCTSDAAVWGGGGGGRNNAEMYAVLVVTPPPSLQREVNVSKGGA